MHVYCRSISGIGCNGEDPTDEGFVKTGLWHGNCIFFYILKTIFYLYHVNRMEVLNKINILVKQWIREVSISKVRSSLSSFKEYIKLPNQKKLCRFLAALNERSDLSGHYIVCVSTVGSVVGFLCQLTDPPPPPPEKTPDLPWYKFWTEFFFQISVLNFFPFVYKKISHQNKKSSEFKIIWTKMHFRRF